MSTRRPPLPPPRLRRLLPLCLALLMAWPADLSSAKGATAVGKEQAVFARFARAWQTRSPKAVVAGMDPRGSARFTLFGYPLSGKSRSMKPAQARAASLSYFKRISAIRLRDVTARKTPANVRLYEYTYKPAGENARTTHLQVQLKRDRKRRWVLASVTESR